MNPLLPVAAVALLAVPVFAGPKVGATPKAKKVNLPTGPSPRAKLAAVAKAAIGDDILCVCQDGAGGRALGQLQVSVPPLATAPVRAKCAVALNYRADGTPNSHKACTHFEVIGRLQPGDEFPF